jgi:hypothetical protein
MNKDGIVGIDKSVQMLLGWLIGGEQAISAYDGCGLA